MVWTIPLNSSGTGLDWDWIRERYLQNASPEEAEAQLRSLSKSWGQKPPKTPEQARAEKSAAAKAAHAKAITQEQIDLMIAYYQARNRVPWIAKELGVTEATVRKYLREADVYEPNRDFSRK